MRFSFIAAAFLLLFSGSVFSASSTAIQLDITKETFQQQQDRILKAINTDVDYSEISANDRALIHKSLTSIADMLKEGQSFMSVANEVQQQILSAQKAVNDALLQAKKDSRMICKKEPVLGSNFDKKVCRTAASLKRENERVRDDNASGRSDIN